jgi:hypothetical protein
MSDQATAPAEATEKSCGSCTECCRMMAVPELYKPAWIYCGSCAKGVGCKIYPDRPQTCRDFMCGWLMAPYMGPELRPDRCHVMLYQPDADTIVALGDPDRPEAWRAPNVLELLHFLAEVFKDRAVLVRVENRYWRITETSIISITS